LSRQNSGSATEITRVKSIAGTCKWRGATYLGDLGLGEAENRGVSRQKNNS